jgi:predicted nucleic acid-binding protein
VETLIVDTNIVIYSIKGMAAVEPYVMDYDLAVSEISLIELFGVKAIDDFTLNKRKKFIKTCSLLPFNTEIREIAISIKQAYSVKVPDAVIAATAIHYGLILLTADKDFKKIKELTSILLQL